MRLFVSLSVLFITATLLVVYSNSFTTAGVKNEATLSITSEENALIALDYEKGEKLTITNNTEKTITIESVSIISDSNHKITTQGKEGPVSLNSSARQVYNITGNPKELAGKVIIVKARWSGGSADIKSTIPNLREKLTIELNELEKETELDNEQPITEPESEGGIEVKEEDISELDSELEEGGGK